MPTAPTGVDSARSLEGIYYSSQIPRNPAVLTVLGIRDHSTAPRSPWQNGQAERLIGSICWECLDHILVFGEAHLSRILAAYISYYNELRTHLSVR
jgi:hypothetical protein